MGRDVERVGVWGAFSRLECGDHAVVSRAGGGEVDWRWGDARFLQILSWKEVE